MAARIAALFVPLLLAGCATTATSPAVESAPPAAAADNSPHGRLHRLFHESDEANLRRNPISAIFRGDLRYADRLGDFYSDESDAIERRAAEEELAALARIDRASLNETDRLAYDVFKYTRENDLRDLQPDLMALTSVRPINHFFGAHTFYPVFSSGRSAAPFRTHARLRQQHQAAPPVRRGARPRDRPLPAWPRLGRGRYQAHHPQRHRPARHPASRRARGLALLRAGAELPGSGAGGGPGATARGISHDRR